MKDKVADIIRVLGMGLNELVFDFEIDGVNFNSIEWDPEQDKVFLHIFDEEMEMDHHCDFEGIDIDKQIKIYKTIAVFLN
jgi:hypothetical protein